jgi:hypothetical protein
MENFRGCAVAWCTGPHDNDSALIAHHRAVIVERTIDGTIVAVTALWAEKLNGRGGVEPHLAIIASTTPDVLHVDFTTREAATFSKVLTLLGGPVWLAEGLYAGTWMLAPYCDHESDGLPHRVAESVPQQASRHLTWGLVIEVFDILERHGYRKASDGAGGRASGLLLDLVDAYEGIER